MWGDGRHRSQSRERIRTKQRGQAMLESALVMLVFLTVLIGIVGYGPVSLLPPVFDRAARVAARYGAVHPYTSPGLAIQSVAIYNDPRAGQRATALMPYLNTTAGSNGYISATLSARAPTTPGSSLPSNTIPTPFLPRTCQRPLGSGLPSRQNRTRSCLKAPCPGLLLRSMVGQAVSPARLGSWPWDLARETACHQCVNVNLFLH